MATQYLYDLRDRLSAITHLDAPQGTPVEEYAYTLDDGGLIDRIDHLDGSYWEYLYDARYRLTSAVRHNPTDTIRASYAYAYDDGDNMTSKATPFEDDFSDKDIGGWGVWSGTWEVGLFSKHYLYASSGGGQIVRNHSDPDHEVRFSYYGDGLTGSLGPAVAFRHSGASERIWLYIRSNKVGLAQTDDGVQSTLDENTGVTTANGTWYEFRIVADGPDAAVWRREKDGDGPWEEVLSTSNCTVTTTNRLWINAKNGDGSRFDDFFVLSDGLSNTTTFTYNGANELVSSTDYNFTTNYAYDEFGRLTGTTTVGGGPFTDYAYDYDDRLIGVDINGEPPVTYQYGGDGLLRTRTHNGETTTFNWNGLNVASEEDDSGNLTRTYVGRTLAHVDGTNPPVGTYAFYGTDAHTSTRGIYDESKQRADYFEYTPYGDMFLNSSPTATTRLYTGHDFDTVTNQYWTVYRWYSPDQSRWTTHEPLGILRSPNLYAYAANSPVLYRDPDGQWVVAIIVVPGIIGAGFGAIGAALCGADGNGILKGAAIGGGTAIGLAAVGYGLGAALGGVSGGAVGRFATTGAAKGGPAGALAAIRNLVKDVAKIRGSKGAGTPPFDIAVRGAAAGTSMAAGGFSEFKRPGAGCL